MEFDSSDNATSFRAVDDLWLDPRNPRFGFGRETVEASQDELVLHMAEHYDAVQVAESIARNGYFGSEPLIAVEEDGQLVVVEGNRRLAALKLLRHSDLRALAAAKNPKWGRLKIVEAPAQVPVYVAKSREAVAPLLGFRHVTGLKKWESAAQAKFIADQIDSDGRSFEEIANEIGVDQSDVRALYRDISVLEQADTQFKLDTSGPRQSFGIWTNALGRRGIRTYIGAPQPRSVTEDAWPIPVEKREELQTVLSLIFGGPGEEEAVIRDSRQLGDLSRVLEGPPDVKATLLSERDLEAAIEELDLETQSKERATRQLMRALGRYRDRHVGADSSDVVEAINGLRGLLNSTASAHAAQDDES